MTHYDFIVNPADLRDFVKALGWVSIPEAATERLYAFNHPQYRQRQLSFPMDTTAPDYLESISLVIERLADIEDVTPASMSLRICTFREDTLRFRVLLDQDDSALPLSFAALMVAGVEQLLRAAACTVVKPQRHHKRLTRTEAKEVAEAARFRHTQPGSFVLPVSCPVNAVDARPALLPGEHDAPFIRRTTRMLERAIFTLIQGVEQDTLDKLVSDENAGPPIVSSNLCEALLQFHDPTLRNSLEFEIDWAPSLPEKKGRRIRIQRDHFARIDEVGAALKKVESYLPDTFIGTVEHLAGEMGDDGRRAGEVLLALLMPESEVVRARVQLDAEQYARADHAHMIDGVYIKVTGKLHPGRQPRSFTDMSSFEVLWPPGYEATTGRG